MLTARCSILLVFHCSVILAACSTPSEVKTPFIFHPFLFSHPIPKMQVKVTKKHFRLCVGKTNRYNLQNVISMSFAVADLRLHDMVSVLWIKFKWKEKAINNTSLFGVIKMWNEEKCIPAAWEGVFSESMDIVNVGGRINKTQPNPGISCAAELVGRVGAVSKW